MPKKSTVPDAWDDDWETLADKQEDAPNDPQEPEVKLSRAELKAKHQEANKQLWNSAESSQDQPIFLQARGEVPLKSDFKPAVKLLSRKPPPKIASRGDPTSGVAGLNIADDDDSEEEERKKNELSFAERQAKAQREREEKRRKYEEVRERLFGSPAPASDTSPAPSSPKRDQSAGSRNSRGKGRAKGDPNGQPSSADQSPARGGNPKRQLYDPSYSAKPSSVYAQKKDAGEATGSLTLAEHQTVRAPRGPDGSGRGGFGFAPRGNASR